MKRFVKLTAPNGNPIYFKAEAIVHFNKCVGERERVSSEITVSSRAFYVRESPEQICKLLEEYDV